VNRGVARVGQHCSRCRRIARAYVTPIASEASNAAAMTTAVTGAPSQVRSPASLATVPGATMLCHSNPFVQDQSLYELSHKN